MGVAGKLKKREEKMCDLLKTITPDYESEMTEGDNPKGIEGRITKIEGRMNDLQKALSEQPSVKNKDCRNADRRRESSMDGDRGEQGSSGHAAATVGQESTKVKKNRRYRPLDMSLENRYANKRKYYMVTFNEEARRSVNPYVIIDKITQVTGHPPVRVTGNNRASVTIEINEGKDENICAIDKIDGISCKVLLVPKYNHTKGLIYVYEYDLEDTEEFKIGLQEQYNVIGVQQATFIKTKSPNTRAFILTFSGDNIPYSIYIPGEKQDTRVFKFRNKPLMCNNCHKYGHVKRYCRQESPTCSRCAVSGHSLDQCESETAKCLHCGGDHAAGSSD